MGSTVHEHSDDAIGAGPTPAGAAPAETRDDSRPPPAEATAHPDHRAADPATNPTPATSPPASGAPSHPWRRGLLWAGAVAVVAFGGYALAPTVKTMMETVSTDDAYVNGHVTYVAPRVAGQVSRRFTLDCRVELNPWRLRSGSYVHFVGSPALRLK